MDALFRLAFATAPLISLTWPQTLTRWLIMQKARCRTYIQKDDVLQPLLNAGFQDLFHLSIRDTFHLSLTVLVHYRSLGNI